MKYKNKQLYLQARLAFYDKQSGTFKHANKRPGSQKK